MNLTQQIDNEYLAAYKKKDAVTVSVLRLLKTAFKNYQVEHKQPPDDAVVLEIIARQCKQRQDSITQFRAAGRENLAQKEEAELVVLQNYLPEQLTDEALQSAVAAAIQAVGAVDMRDMGKVMQKITTDHQGRIDGKTAAAAVRRALQNL